ncbi:MAG: hypothetical protein AW07_02447 [Candidatus Accumulibacter sp. SK-11]|nr:MAG: hypothetical protein AW07_02447 [Candidatus Accumulibacter sp. SK-11]
MASWCGFCWLAVFPVALDLAVQGILSLNRWQFGEAREDPAEQLLSQSGGDPASRVRRAIRMAGSFHT